MPTLFTADGDLTDDGRYLLAYLVRVHVRHYPDPAFDRDDVRQDVLLTALRTTWGYDPAKGKLSTWLSRIVRTVQDRHHRFHHRMCRDRRRTRPLPEKPRFKCREMEPLETLIEMEEAAA